ncbi:hypothetical protein JCM16303_006363 [Sporobolomyces ruberrimus]
MAVPPPPPAAVTPTLSETNQSGITNGSGRLKIVFKGVPADSEVSLLRGYERSQHRDWDTDQKQRISAHRALFRQQYNPIASPLPHPPSPSAPASSTFSATSGSPDPDPALPLALGASSTTEPQAARDAAAFGTVAAADASGTGTSGRKSKAKGKGKKRSKGSKRRTKDSVLEPSPVVGEAPIPEPTTQVEVTGVEAGREQENVASTSAIPLPPTTVTGPTSLNRVCHHHKSLTKGETRMTCSNKPDCRTIWCKTCIDKYYLDCTPTSVFVEGATFLCPVCTDRCKCAGCRKKRKESAKEARRANSLSVAASTSTEGARRSITPLPGSTLAGSGEVVVKMEDTDEHRFVATTTSQDQQPSIPSSTFPDSAIDPSLLPPPAPSAQPPLQPILPATAPVPSTISPVPPPLPPTAQPSGILKIRVKPPTRPRTERGTFVPLPMSGEPYPLETEEVVASPANARRGRGGARRGAGRRTNAASTTHFQPPFTGGGGRIVPDGTSFFGRAPTDLVGVAAGNVGGIRPKRTKKVSSHYDDFAVEGVPAFVPEGDAENGAGQGRESRNATGRWGGYRRGAGGRRKAVEPVAATSNVPVFPGSSFMSTTTTATIGRDGKPRRRPRLSGLSSASSCSELSSAGGMDEDDYESRYWAAKEEFAERESDQRVRHWLLVPPDEPQPVLAGLERNLSEGGGEEVGFSPTASTEIDVGKKKKEKVKWIEGPERRRRRALALQRMNEQEDGEGDRAGPDGCSRTLKRSLSWDTGDAQDKTNDLYNHCQPIKPFGDGSSPSKPSPQVTKAPLPVRASSAPTHSAVPPLAQKSADQERPLPYTSHFPPSIAPPLAPSNPQPPKIVVSPASRASASPLTSHPSAPVSPSSELDPDLAARSADDKRLGLRLLDAIRTITGSLSSSVLSTSTTPECSASDTASSAPMDTAPVVTSSSPVKTESDDALSLLISQEHAEYVATRREERERLLATALDPRKAFRAEAKGNDASLLERATDWGAMEVDSDSQDKNFRRNATSSALIFDYERFVFASNNEEDSTSVWNTSTSTSLTASTSVTPTSPTMSSTLEDSARPCSPGEVASFHQTLDGSTPDTPAKSVSSSHLSAPVLSLSTESSHPWSLSNLPIGGAATPTRGLVMELDLDFDHAGGGMEGGCWSALEE